MFDCVLEEAADALGEFAVAFVEVGEGDVGDGFDVEEVAEGLPSFLDAEYE